MPYRESTTSLNNSSSSALNSNLNNTSTMLTNNQYSNASSTQLNNEGYYPRMNKRSRTASHLSEGKLLFFVFVLNYNLTNDLC